MPYEMLSHTADAGIRVSAPTLERLFEDAARGMFAIISDAPPEGWPENFTVSIAAASPSDLLVDWLSELLYLFDVKKLWPLKISVALAEGALSAAVEGIKFRGVITGTEIKAVTYHMLNVRQTAINLFETDIYFDL